MNYVPNGEEKQVIPLGQENARIERNGIDAQ